MKEAKLILIGVATAGLFACNGPGPIPPGPGNKADLIPVPDPRPGWGFCRPVPSGPDKGKLIITVKNQGTGNAPASSTKIEFFPGGSVTIATPAIPAGSSVDLAPVTIPAPAWNPDANFEITVDSYDQVDESNEGNNTGTGICVG